MIPLRSLFVTCVFLASMSVLVPSASAEDSKVIKDGMKSFHKGDTALIKKVVAGQATDEEIKSLQAYYKSIVAEKPPLGDEASWKDKTAALNKAVDEVAAKDPNGIAHLKEATNCKACHSVHKPK